MNKIAIKNTVNNIVQIIRLGSLTFLDFLVKFMEVLGNAMSLVMFLIALSFYALSGMITISILYIGVFFNKMSEEIKNAK